MYLGFVALEDSVFATTMAVNASNVPINADALPTYRVYGPLGLMSGGSGSMAKKDDGSITGATNASPIVITSVAHGLTTGTRITVASVGGNTAANGTFVVTRVDADTFSLDSSTGNGSYTSGGVWNVTGLYEAEIEALAANGYDAGQSYTVLVTYAVSGTTKHDLHTFTVV